MLNPINPSVNGREPSGLLIRVSAGSGIGPTRLAAFDSALRSAGVADFNLIRLSSVIPPGATVTTSPADDQIRGKHGDLLYCVYADAYASTPGEQAWAGIAWSRRDDGSGEGLFVEHSGASRPTVERDLRATLEAMSVGRAFNFAPAGSLVSSAECADHPVCAVVIAAYCRASWDLQADQTMGETT
jgi:arginine decarboxylase